MLNARSLRILLPALILLRCLAPAQNSPQREYVFSGNVSEADCREMPTLLFAIGPSMNRAETKDHLTVRYVRGKGAEPAQLSLTFTIVGEVNLNHGDTRSYSFRWGNAIPPRPSAMQGQFTKDPKLCTRLVDLFDTRVPKTISTSSENISKSPQWSAGCYGDDFWGTSMEVTITGRIGESL